MTAIDVVVAGNQLYEVEIRDHDGTSTHQVSVADAFLARLDTEGVAVQDLVFAAMAFLTEVEGHHELDERVELAEVAERYEGFADRIADLARQGTLQQARREPDGDQAPAPSGDERLLAEVRREQRDGEASRPTEAH